MLLLCIRTEHKQQQQHSQKNHTTNIKGYFQTRKNIRNIIKRINIRLSSEPTYLWRAYMNGIQKRMYAVYIFRR